MPPARRSRAGGVPAVAGNSRPAGSALGRLYRGETNFDFINRWKYWFALSGAVIAVGLVALGVRGLNFSIDFKGGTEWQVPTNASVATVKADLASVSPVLNKATVIQLTSRTTGKKNIQVELPSSVTSNTHLVDQVTSELAKIAHLPVDQVTFNAVGPSWGSTITNKAIEAVVVFVVLIFLAIAVYFETKMAVGAIVALIHDMAVTVGIYALSGFQVSPDTVIAFLTVLGYSLYDTIVVFDKVKENTKGLASTNRVTYTDVVNLSMNQVLARSVNTSFVAIMPVFCILVIGSWILGASALNDFGLALFIGLLSGAYSSIFIASPVLALLKEREPRYVEIRRRIAAYPQSRQVLTTRTVAGGALIASRAAAAKAPALSTAKGPASRGDARESGYGPVQHEGTLGAAERAAGRRGAGGNGGVVANGGPGGNGGEALGGAEAASLSDRPAEAASTESLSIGRASETGAGAPGGESAGAASTLSWSTREGPLLGPAAQPAAGSPPPGATGPSPRGAGPQPAGQGPRAVPPRPRPKKKAPRRR